MFIIENVKGLTMKEHKRDFDRIMNDLNANWSEALPTVSVPRPWQRAL